MCVIASASLVTHGIRFIGYTNKQVTNQRGSMKALPIKVLPAFACMFIALLLTACAAQTSRTPYAEASHTAKYMYHTERNAQSRMVTVYWINPPKSIDLAKSAARAKADEDES